MHVSPQYDPHGYVVIVILVIMVGITKPQKPPGGHFGLRRLTINQIGMNTGHFIGEVP